MCGPAWLLSLSITFSRATHTVVCASASFLWPDTIPVCGWATSCLSIHQLTGTWAFPLRSYYEYAAAYILVQGFTQVHISISPEYVPKSGIAGHVVTSNYICVRSYVLFRTPWLFKRESLI